MTDKIIDVFGLTVHSKVLIEINYKKSVSYIN